MTLDIPTTLDQLQTQSVAAVARQLGVGESRLDRWYRQHTTAEQRQALGRAKMAESKKGSPPWNKGLHICTNPGGGFQKGHRYGHAHRLPVGTLRIRTVAGRKIRQIKYTLQGKTGGAQWMAVGRWRWICANGPVPPDHRLLYRDGDSLNDALQNMQVVAKGRHLANLLSDPIIANRRARNSGRGRRGLGFARAVIKKIKTRVQINTTLLLMCDACGHTLDKPGRCPRCNSWANQTIRVREQIARHTQAA